MMKGSTTPEIELPGLEELLKLRQLRIALMVQECGNLTKAAERLGITHAAVSKTISEIEGTIGAAIFVRNNRVITPTLVGTKFLQSCRVIIGELRTLKEEIAYTVSGTVGTVIVGVKIVSTHNILVRAIANLKLQFPDIAIRIIDAPIGRLFEDLRESRIDLVIGRILPNLMQADLEGIPIEIEESAVVASSGHPVLANPDLGWENIIDEEWCLPLKGTPLRDQFDMILAEKFLPAPTRTVEGISLPGQAMIHCIFPVISLVPMSVAADWRNRGYVGITNLRIPKNEPIGLIWSKSRNLTPAAKNFRDEILNIIKLGNNWSIPLEYPGAVGSTTG